MSRYRLTVSFFVPFADFPRPSSIPTARLLRLKHRGDDIRQVDRNIEVRRMLGLGKGNFPIDKKLRELYKQKAALLERS